MIRLLEQALVPQNLRLAWEEVDENKGVGGVDGVSLKAWRRNWEERLVELARSVRANTYRPHKLRLKRIPKRNQREFHVLRIPTISDRVLQRAVLEILYPVFEPRFLDCSFGYRPRRGLREAVQRIIVLRENDYRWILDADIDEFFSNVDHALLLDFLRRDLPDDSLLPLITRWLELGCSRSRFERDLSRFKRDLQVGIPLGSPLSPLWANVFLHRLDLAVARQGREMVRYADDFVVFAESRREVEKAYAEVEKTLAALHLCYEPGKTHLTSFDEGFDFIGVRFLGDEYSYTYMDKEIKVSGDEVDWLFSRYGPEYE